MSENSKMIDCYGHDSELYSQRFQLFLDSTDQKLAIRQWVKDAVDKTERSLFIDAGAGEGSLTGFVANEFAFESVIAIEPDKRFQPSIREKCPKATIVASPIGEALAKSDQNADFVLCSHVLYYLPRQIWLDTAATMASWLAPGSGMLAIILQHPDSDCSRMFRHFSGDDRTAEDRNLSSLAAEFLAERRLRQRVAIETLSAKVEVDEPEKAYLIAEFLIQALPLEARSKIERQTLRDYVSQNFYDAERRKFWFSVNQDVLTIASV